VNEEARVHWGLSLQKQKKREVFEQTYSKRVFFIFQLVTIDKSLAFCILLISICYKLPCCILTKWYQNYVSVYLLY